MSIKECQVSEWASCKKILVSKSAFKHERTKPIGRGEVLASINGHDDSASVAEEIVRRKRAFSSGVYIKGNIENVPVILTTDTGATRTIISDRVYNKLDPKIRPQLNKSACLTGASGIPLKECGKAFFNVELGPVSMYKELIVAEIEDDVLLGIDILQNDDGGPADILLSKGVIVLKGKNIPCIQIGMKNDVRKVTAADHFIISPPQRSGH